MVARRAQRMSVLGIVGRLIAAIAIAIVAAFCWFILTLPRPTALTERTDAVVVLTGGEGRLARGLEVLDARAAGRMLVSGVGRATRAQIAEANGVSAARLAGIDLGYEAVDTRSNAEETTRWVERNRFDSIRLVTSAGHMRRALLELSVTLPASVRVVPDAVPVEPKSPVYEFGKYALRRVALAVGVK